jgi:LysR family transcriptional regulator, cyn operon transcriptional activator
VHLGAADVDVAGYQLQTCILSLPTREISARTRMELRHIRYFVRAAELLHFTRAAESLHISQPALSLHIKQLEKEVGAPLFERTYGHVRHVRLTEAGKRMLVHAQEILRAVERGKQEIADLRGLLCGSVTLGANNIFVRRLMSTSVAGYTAAYPNVDVIVKMANQDELESGILAGTIDLALAWLPSESTAIEAETLFADELVVVVSPQHPLAHLEKISLRELENRPIALPTVATNIRRKVNVEFAKQNVALRISLEIDDTPARLRFVEAGVAATVAPKRAVDDWMSLRALPIAGVELPLSAGLLTQRGAHLSSAAQALAGMIRADFRE